MESVLGDEHRMTMTAMNNLAVAREARGDLDGAEPLYLRAAELRRRVLGPKDPDTLVSLNNLAYLHLRRNRVDRAEPVLVEALAATREIHGPKHHLTITMMNNLGFVYEQQGKFDEAEPLYVESVEIERAKKPLSDPFLMGMVVALARIYQAQDKDDKAEALLAEVVAAARKDLGDDHPKTASLLANIGLHHLKAKKYAEAESELRASLAVRENKEPDLWTTFNTRSMLGGALLGQNKHADAEPYVLDGYAGMKKQEKNIPPQGKVRLKEAGERIVDLYEAWGKKDEAAKWRKELEAMNKEP
jgi:tetratricopeptide (TPR) repeat protein